MNMTNRQTQTTFALLFMAVTLLAASYYIKEKQEDYRSMVMVKLAEQETEMVRFAELIDRESADATVNKVVKDCEPADRERFDTLLGNLSQLAATELREVDTLFPACGSYFADRQAILAARLTREVEMYVEYIELLGLTSADTEEYEKKLVLWQKIDTEEAKRSELVTQLVDIQAEIIDLLVAGESINSDAINAKLQEAQTTKETLSLLGTQTDSLRLEISDL